MSQYPNMFLRLFSLFSGIGAFEKALTRLNIPFEIIGFSEIDKYAVKAYCAIHDISSSKNFGDITLIDEKSLPDFDLLTYGFPCQDLSLSGKRQGLIDENGNKTKSGLIFDALRIIQYKKPKYSIAENVKGLVTRKFKKDFEWLLQELESYGYNNYWKVLNAKDYGIPQNRERVFIVSIRKDIDDGTFDFPKPIGCKLKLKNLLEDKRVVHTPTTGYLLCSRLARYFCKFTSPEEYYIIFFSNSSPTLKRWESSC